MPKTNTNGIFHGNASPLLPPTCCFNFKPKCVITDIQAGEHASQTLPLPLALWVSVHPTWKTGRRTLQFLMRRL